MSNTSMSGSHQVSISHDPIEEHTTAGFDQLRSGRDGWPSGGAPYRGRGGDRRSSLQDMLPSLDSADLRPVLLAGAIGLFAAWIVSGMTSSGVSRRRESHNDRTNRDRSPRQSASPPSRQPQPRFSTGPEGSSSPADLSLDAMNP